MKGDILYGNTSLREEDEKLNLAVYLTDWWIDWIVIT